MRAVPIQLFADTHAHRDATEQNNFRQISRDIEVAIGRGPPRIASSTV
jgi:hypothetical protein